MRMKSWWLVVPGLLAMIMSACITSSLPGSSAEFAWVATEGDQKLTAFSVNATTGTVSQVGSAVATGVTPLAIAMTPDGKTLFVANAGDGTIGAYTVNSDGSIKAQGTTPSQGQFPSALVVDPTGKLLFVANQGTFTNNTSGTVAVFAISSGQLSGKAVFPTETATSASGSGPAAVAVSPAAFSCKTTQATQSCYAVYVANEFTNEVAAYDYYLDMSGNFVLGSVDASGNFIAGGTVANSPYQPGQNPSSLAFSRCAGTTTATANCTGPDSNNLFVANSGSNNVSVFSACIQASATCASPDGSLTLVAGSPVAAGVGPAALIVDPALDFVYVVDVRSNQISQYKYSPATGALTALSPAAASSGTTGASPLSGGMTPDGNFLLVPNNGGSNMFVFKVTVPSGSLAPASASSVPLSGQPSAVLVR
ncbi:MAG: beta-propeller fold lactonase family protein [Acidobacteria bacterium]|nr:beta-propeller fold lactonase family protein [Acidobacteriota bacterium]